MEDLVLMIAGLARFASEWEGLGCRFVVDGCGVCGLGFDDSHEWVGWLRLRDIHESLPMMVVTLSVSVSVHVHCGL